MWRPRGLANNIPLRRWIPGRCPSPRHPRNDRATSVPLRHTPSRKKIALGGYNRRSWKQLQKSMTTRNPENRKITFDIYNNHSRRYIVRSLKFSKGVSNIVVPEALGYHQSQYQTCQKRKHLDLHKVNVVKWFRSMGSDASDVKPKIAVPVEFTKFLKRLSLLKTS